MLFSRSTSCKHSIYTGTLTVQHRLMKIGIFESEHFEATYPVIKLFDTPGNEVHIFTDPFTHKRLADLFGPATTRYHWTILKKGFSRLLYFRQLYRQIKKLQPDILYINTISANHILFALLIRLLRIPRTVVTVHDINCLFHSTPSWNIRAMVHHLGKKLLIRWVKEFNVISDTMVPYLQQQTSKVIHNVPGAVFDGLHHPVQPGNYFHLVVPGTIDKKRRDYTQVWALLQEAERKQFPLHLTLLGGYADAYGKNIIAEADNFPSYYTHIRFYDTAVVDQDEFDRQMGQAHFVFIPSVINTAICHNIPEIYGVTKSSGNIFDGIRHARPFIIPATLQVPAALTSSAFTYGQVTDIISFLQQLQQEPARYPALLEQAMLNSGEFTIDKVRARNPTLFIV